MVKPVESAGSDGVTACRSFTEVHAAVKKLVGAVNGLGQVNEVKLALAMDVMPLCSLSLCIDVALFSLL